MNYTTIKKAGVVLALLLTTSAYAYNQNSAKNACINKVTQHGSSQYHGASNIHISDKGHHSYGITGNVKSSRDKQTHHFSCQIRHKEVVNWNVKSSTAHKNNTAAAIGVGILALAVASAVNKSDKHHTNDRHKDYDTGGSAFSDMKYLKRQCKKNIRYHLKRDHGNINRIALDSAHLHNRKLTGTGYVEFARGGKRDLNYNCSFDRRGNIHDGYYRYRNRR
ncbi:MAG: hypothetical protein Q9M39_01685 [Sulfurovum sp.]|nr:hypothetical protein [Sulfurovum sp.]